MSTSAALWRRAVLEGLPLGGPYLYGGDGLPGEPGDCSNGVGRAADSCGLNDGRRWTTASLRTQVPTLKAGLPGPADVGAVGWWNGGRHVMMWTGAGWYGYHGSAGDPSSIEAPSYWASAYEGWGWPWAFTEKSERAQVVKAFAQRAESNQLTKLATNYPRLAGVAAAWAKARGAL